MFRIAVLLSVCITLLTLMSCAKDRSANEARYIEIPSVTFANHQSGRTHGITEVWAYADSVFVGAYNVPTRFPLVDESQSTIEFFAGIRQNASGSDLAIYPFYTRHRSNISGLEDQIIVPNFTYLPAVEFPYIETFEGVHGLTLDLTGESTSPFSRVNVDGIEGFFGESTLTSSQQRLEVASRSVFELPSDSRAVYMEFDYRGEMDWQIGLGLGGDVVDIDRRYVLQLLPQESWQKVYLDLSPALRGANADQVRIILRGQFDNARSDIVRQLLQIDNLKVVHFGP